MCEEALAFLAKQARKKAGREEDPSYGIIDSQSIKSVYRGNIRGYDRGKKNKRAQTAYHNRHAGELVNGKSTRSEQT